VYRSADIVVIPTERHEGTSLSCVEALYLGKPVIATYIGGLPNLVMPQVNGELVAPTVAELAGAMARLLECPQLRAQYSHAAQAIAQEFSLAKWRAAVWRVIQQSLLSD
jgi:glycosyltransferase involved in cell wall biosynthesis